MEGAMSSRADRRCASGNSGAMIALALGSLAKTLRQRIGA
jgi:hypothetical protein